MPGISNNLLMNLHGTCYVYDSNIFLLTRSICIFYISCPFVIAPFTTFRRLLSRHFQKKTVIFWQHNDNLRVPTEMSAKRRLLAMTNGLLPGFTSRHTWILVDIYIQHAINAIQKNIRRCLVIINISTNLQSTIFHKFAWIYIQTEYFSKYPLHQSVFTGFWFFKLSLLYLVLMFANSYIKRPRTVKFLHSHGIL